MKKIAHDVVLDYRDESITIDGIPFPFYVEPDPEVSVAGEGTIGVLHIGVLASNLTVIGPTGTIVRPIQAPLGVELRWAAERAKEIVRDQMADVIAWIAKGAPR